MKFKALTILITFIKEITVGQSKDQSHCLPPALANGKANCPGKIIPGATCSVICNRGYIATPGKGRANCQRDGSWDHALQCEIPVVVIAGGIGKVNGKTLVQRSGEILSLYPSQGCNITIRNMPKPYGTKRAFHNLIYTPGRGKLLVCNGITGLFRQYPRASCDQYLFKAETWWRDSYPNEGMEKDYSCDFGHRPSTCMNPDRRKGRYAAQAVVSDDIAYVVGGMLYDEAGHTPTRSSRIYVETGVPHIKDYWNLARKQKQSRAFFCLVKVEEDGAFSIGGLGRIKNMNEVLKTMDFSVLSLNKSKSDLGPKYPNSFALMKRSRAGHSCTSLPIRNFTILVSGGTGGFGLPAEASAEIFSLEKNSWRNVGSMKKARFGHAVVNVGHKVFAIGGEDRENNNYFDSIEEFDVTKESWKIISQRIQTPRSNFGYTLIPHSLVDGCKILD